MNFDDGNSDSSILNFILCCLVAWFNRVNDLPLFIAYVDRS